MASNGLPSFRKQRDLSMLGNGSRQGASAVSDTKPLLQPAASSSTVQKPKSMLLAGAPSPSSSGPNSMFKINVKRALETPVILPVSTSNEDATTKPKPTFNKPAEKPAERNNKRSYVNSTGFFGQLTAVPSAATKRAPVIQKARNSCDGITDVTSRGETVVKSERLSTSFKGRDSSPSKLGDSKLSAIDLTRLPAFEFYSISSGDQLDIPDVKTSRRPVRLPLGKLSGAVKTELKTEKRARISDGLTDTITNVLAGGNQQTAGADETVDIKPVIAAAAVENVNAYSNSKNGKGMFDDVEFVLIELPDAFPISLRDTERDARANESAESGSNALQQAGSKQPLAAQSDLKPDANSAAQASSKAGRNGPVGYVEVCESGRCFMVVADASEPNVVHRFELNSVAQSGFLQDVCLFRSNETDAGTNSADRRPEFIKLGPVGQRVLCVPSIDSLFEFDYS